MMHQTAAAAVFLAASVASTQAQGSYLYEFDLILIENQLIDNGISSRFDALTVGTTGRLTMEVSQTATHFPGFSDSDHQYYSVLDVSLTVGSVVDTDGTPGIYPTSSHATTLLVSNDSLLLSPDTYADQIGTFFSFDAADIVAPFILMNEVHDDGTFPDVFSDADLPDAASLMALSYKHFFFNTTYGTAERIRFGFTGASRTYIPVPGSAALLGLGGLALARRRR